MKLEDVSRSFRQHFLNVNYFDENVIPNFRKVEVEERLDVFGPIQVKGVLVLLLNFKNSLVQVSVFFRLLGERFVQLCDFLTQ